MLIVMFWGVFFQYGGAGRIVLLPHCDCCSAGTVSSKVSPQMSTFSSCPSGQRGRYEKKGAEVGGGGQSDHMANEINGGKTDKAG